MTSFSFFRCASVSVSLAALLWLSPGCDDGGSAAPDPLAGAALPAAPLPSGAVAPGSAPPPAPSPAQPAMPAAGGAHTSQPQGNLIAGALAGNTSQPGTGMPGGVPPGTTPGSAPVGGVGPAAAGVPTGTAVPGAATSVPAASAGTTGTAPAAVLVQTGDMAGLARATGMWQAQPGEVPGVKRMKDKPVLAGYSWMVPLLPHLGHQDVYSKFNLEKPWTDDEKAKEAETSNLQLSGTIIPAFLDPTNPQHRWKGFPFLDDGPGLTHYVGMSGIEDGRNVVAAALARSDPRAGVFGYDQVARLAEITDGASNTIMLIGSGKMTGPWVQGGGATIRGARAPYFDALTGFGSATSPGSGAIVLMADGSVKTISKDIDPAVFRALCTIHGAESIDLTQLSGVVQPKN
jgi:hypothetical protein